MNSPHVEETFIDCAADTANLLLSEVRHGMDGIVSPRVAASSAAAASLAAASLAAAAASLADASTSTISQDLVCEPNTTAVADVHVGQHAAAAIMNTSNV